MNTCSICKHENRDEIEVALAHGTSLRDIARQFGASKDSINRHQKCIVEAFVTARHERAIASARTVEAELDRAFQFVNKMLRACDEWLTDPENPDAYTLDARDTEIEVIYKEQDGEDAKGKPRYIRKRSKLSALLKRVEEGTEVLIEKGESRYFDPRKLVLETIGKLHDSIEQLGKLTGAWQKDRENENDERRTREIMIEGLMMVYAKRGEPKTREQCAAEIDESTRALEEVWVEAEKRAVAKGYIN